MYEYIVGEYLKKLKVQDVLDYAKNNNLVISESDAIILLSYAKRYYKELLGNNPTDILKEIKQKINPETYKMAYKMYIESKMKYIK